MKRPTAHVRDDEPEFDLDDILCAPDTRRRWDHYPAATASQAQAHRALNWWAFEDDGPRRYCVVMGPCGTGKTDLARSLFAEMLNRFDAEITDWPPVWVDGPALIKALPQLGPIRCGNPWRHDCDWRQMPAVTKVILSSFLVIDDFRLPESIHEKRLWQSLIDERNRQGNCSGLITTNHTSSELHKALGDRAFDRLNDRALWVALNGPSLRRPRVMNFNEDTEEAISV